MPSPLAGSRLEKPVGLACLLTLYGLGALAWAAAERGETERAGVLWAAIEAEEARAPNPMWAIYRDRFAAHIPDEPRPSSPLGLDEPAEYALSDG